MPETVAYIWPKRALIYCDSHLSLPAPHVDNNALPHREIVALHNAGFKVKEIAATVPNPSPARPLAGKGGVEPDPNRTPRAPASSLGGKLSQRDQSYRVHLGVFNTCIRKEESKTGDAIHEKLEGKSWGQLFHVSTKTDAS
jgi:hypothetical protein